MPRADALEKTLMLEKDWKQYEKGVTEDETVGWHHRLNGRDLEQNLGDSEGQGSLACYSTWGCKEIDITEQLNKDRLERLLGNTNVAIDNGNHVPKVAQDFRFA